uniref:murein hydrolase activator EnvC family protein n=1 Tax=Altererythrobacter segetis TaxID=1104773 RepID=UPI00140B7714|nr:peptidoglycan DD-metalloendopeptidase family protein [Altererythrobacter segetis]
MNRAPFLFPLAALLAAGAGAVQFSPDADPAATREELRQALADGRMAEARSRILEAQAARAVEAADKTARQAAALAARIQQAEAGIAAAQARISLIDRERQALREQLGAEQRPVVRLTAALQQFSRRPVALSVLRPGSVLEMVYTRALLASAVPVVRKRTSHLRAQLARGRELRRQAALALAGLHDESLALAGRKRQLADIETRQRLASRTATGSAARESERALALAEQARDLSSLVGELDRAGALRRRLAALPGPVLRPARPEDAQLVTIAPSAVSGVGPPPAPYLLPVAGRTVAGFAASGDAGTSNGLTLAPRPGAQVVAPGAGRVAFAGPYRGYGRIVILEHDGGWTSLVTGLARVDVRVGDRLVGGAPLGVAGQGQPTVSLELRRDNEPVNPLQYLR